MLEHESQFNLDTCSNMISHFATSMHILPEVRMQMEGSWSRSDGSLQSSPTAPPELLLASSSSGSKMFQDGQGWRAVGQGHGSLLLLFSLGLLQLASSSSGPRLARDGQGWPRMVLFKDGQERRDVGQGQMAASCLLLLLLRSSCWPLLAVGQGCSRMVKDGGESVKVKVAAS